MDRMPEIKNDTECKQLISAGDDDSSVKLEAVNIGRIVEEGDEEEDETEENEVLRTLTVKNFETKHLHSNLRKSKSNSANGDINGKTYFHDKDLNQELMVTNNKKLRKISALLMSLDVIALKKEAVKARGFISDDVRRKVWPHLVGVNVYDTSPRPTMQEIEEHPYYNQVILDVNRSLKRFPPSIEEKQRLAMQDQLVILIMRVLVKNSELHYYQGYHDICVTFLLVLGEEIAFHVVNTLSKSHLRVFMDKTMERTIDLLTYIHPIIRKESFKLFSFLEKSDVGVMFCLSWLITWFGHVLNKYDDVARLFDFFLASHSWMPMYLSAAIVLHREHEILEQECDMACVHSLLSHIPDDLPFEQLISESCRLYKAYPPKQLEMEEAPARELKKKAEMAKRNRSYGIIFTVVKAIQNAVPTSKFTISFVVAAAVVFYAVIYESYRT